MPDNWGLPGWAHIQFNQSYGIRKNIFIHYYLFLLKQHIVIIVLHCTIYISAHALGILLSMVKSEQEAAMLIAFRATRWGGGWPLIDVFDAVQRSAMWT